MNTEWTSMTRVARRVARTTVAVVVVLVITVAFLTTILLRQSDTLGDNAVVTRDIVNANARTIGQVQRELLRLSALIAGGSTDTRALELHRSFVSQRVDEATLDSQLQTLGSDALLIRTRQLDAAWHAEVEPVVLAIVDDPGAATPNDRQAAIDAIGGLEKAFNDVSTDAEQNRKDQAALANAKTLESLHASRLVLGAIIVLVLAFLGFFVVALLSFRRTARSQAAIARRLGEVNAEMTKLSHVASATDNMVVITDAEGVTEWVNGAFERVTGYAADEVIGLRPGWVLQGPNTDLAEVARLRDAVARGEAHRCVLLNYRNTGEEYWVEMEVQPVRDDNGAVTHFVAIESDVTQRRLAEEQLIRAKEAAESLANEKASFLASMSHEIRTPLNSVIGLTGLLLDTDLTAEQREFAQTARNSGTMLLSIINNILNFSALEAGTIDTESVPFRLSELLDRSVELVAGPAHAKGLTLAVHVDPALPDLIEGDQTRVQQVLVNLVANAVKFTDTGGVSVAATLQPHGTCTAGGDRRDPVGDEFVVSFSVTDTGIGIPVDRLNRLFKPFSQVDASTTRRFGGTGLGLAISHHIVTLLGGSIRVDSAPGVGATFTVELPVRRAREDGAAASVPSVDPAAPLRELRILVAEDDKVNQMVVGRMLDRLGQRADIVNDGLGAIEALGRGHYDVILMDVQMPRLDGVGATQRIRAQLPEDQQPVIVAVTASALEGDREKLIAAGMDLYLSKPIQLQALQAVLETAARRTVAIRRPAPA